MMSLETTHNDHAIRYNENENEWTASLLDLKAKSLSALRTKINEFDAKERKLGSGVTLIHVNQYRSYGPKSVAPKVRATMLDKADIEKNPCVWITHIGHEQREKVGLHVLALDTQENIDILTEVDRLRLEAAGLQKKAEKMVADIKRITVEQIKAMALETKPE